MNGKKNFIYTLIDSPKDLKSAVDRLVKADIALDAISLVMSQDSQDKEFKILELLGGPVGDLLGGLVPLNAFSGMGLVMAGPVLSFAASSGLIEESVHAAMMNGKALMGVHVDDAAQAADVQKILRFADKMKSWSGRADLMDWLFRAGFFYAVSYSADLSPHPTNDVALRSLCVDAANKTARA